MNRLILTVASLVLASGSACAMPSVACPLEPGWSCSVTPAGSSPCGTTYWNVAVLRTSGVESGVREVVITCSAGDRVCSLTVGNADPDISLRLAITAESGSPPLAELRDVLIQRSQQLLVNAGRIEISRMRVNGNVTLIEVSDLNDTIITGNLNRLQLKPSGGLASRITDLAGDFTGLIALGECRSHPGGMLTLA